MVILQHDKRVKNEHWETKFLNQWHIFKGLKNNDSLTTTNDQGLYFTVLPAGHWPSWRKNKQKAESLYMPDICPAKNKIRVLNKRVCICVMQLDCSAPCSPWRGTVFFTQSGPADERLWKLMKSQLLLKGCINEQLFLWHVLWPLFLAKLASRSVCPNRCWGSRRAGRNAGGTGGQGCFSCVRQSWIG